MDIQKLKSFVVLAETLHFNKAAELCHSSPSSLSRNIKQLEDYFNVQLFERDNRSVSITHQGQRFLGLARDLLHQWETLQESMLENTDQLQGELSLYCSVTASYSFLYEILKDFRKLHPLIELTLHTGDPALALDRVSSGQEDISIAAKPDALPPHIKFKRFSYSPLVLIQPKTEFIKEFGDLSENDFWRSVPLIISEKGIARERMDAWLRRKKIQPNIYAQVAGHEAIVSMVSLGFGVGLVPQIVLENSPLANKVEEAGFQPALKAYEVGVAVLEKRLKSPIVQALWSLISEKA